MGMEYDAESFRRLAEKTKTFAVYQAYGHTQVVSDALIAAVWEAERLRAELAAEKARSFFDRPEWKGPTPEKGL